VIDFQPQSIKAIVFDVFGTVADWRSSIINEGQQLSLRKGLSIDWGQFADAWYTANKTEIDRIQSAQAEWKNIDAIHLETLNHLVEQFGIDSALSITEMEQFNRVWHHLKPWPDVANGLKRLWPRYVLAILSNGNTALLVNIGKHARLHWDCVISAEMIKRYKPDPTVYALASQMLGVQPHEIMLIAAHPNDLELASHCGLRTCYLPRPMEFGNQTQPYHEVDDSYFDLVAKSFGDLASMMGT
jgi:2-haloacid dehalogenase